MYLGNSSLHDYFVKKVVYILFYYFKELLKKTNSI